MSLTLLVLAAGMGSRYGGLKQIDPVGPNGETIIDYSVYDALRAGFDRLVFVIRRDIERPFKETIGRRFEGRIAVDYVFQELDKLPLGFRVPDGRKKPWGTGHAILMAAEAIQGPFGVINGDDFYGARSFQALAEHLRADSTTYAMVGYVLRNTLSEFGSVSRGVCELTPDGFLESVTELTKIEKDGSNLRNIGYDGRIQPLTGEEIVSMNIWGFTPSLFSHLRDQFKRFLSQRGQDEKAEFYIPTVVNQLVADGQERVKVLRTPDSWFGITYREDSARVTESIRRLAAQGEYPKKL
jgi:NDP-sugar pyrophosphorylase family protein